MTIIAMAQAENDKEAVRYRVQGGQDGTERSEKMSWLSELWKESFELFVKMRWLKAIEKETKKRDKLKGELERHEYVLNALTKRCCEIYGICKRDESEVDSNGS